MKTTLPKSFGTIAWPAALGILVIIMWNTGLLNIILRADSFTLPEPARIIRIISENFPAIVHNAQATIIVAVAGLLLGSAAGYLLAIIADIFPVWGSGGLKLVAAFNAIPIIAIAPIMNNLTRDFSNIPSERSMFAKILVVMITSTVAMSINAYRGFSELKPFSKDLMRSFAATPDVVFLKLKVPNSIPYIFTALRISVPGSIISAMVSEYFAEYIIGIGRQIRESIVLAQYASAWAYIFAAFFIGIFMYALLLFAEGILLRGRRRA